MHKQTAADHVQALENKRAALAARLGDIMTTAADEAATLTDEQATEYDGLELQVKSLDADLQRWRELEKLQAATATPVPAIVPGRTTSTRCPVISVKPNVPIGTQFVRAACARLLGNGRPARGRAVCRGTLGRLDAGSRAVPQGRGRARHDDGCDLGAAAGQSQIVSKEFIELLRPATILGKIPGLREGAVQHAKCRARPPAARTGGSGRRSPSRSPSWRSRSTTLGGQQGRRDHRADRGTGPAVEPEGRGSGPRAT